jgi:hypothetical protein
VSDSAQRIRASVEAAYRQHFEVTPSRASVSFVGVSPIEVLRYACGAGRFDYLSLGMSEQAMVDPSATVVDAGTAPRAELLLTAGAGPDGIWRRLALLAAGPAVQGLVFDVGHRIDLGEPWYPGSRCTGAVLHASELRPVPVPGNAEVRVLRVLPATADELAWARVHATAELITRWEDQGTDLADLERNSADLG